MNIGDVETVEKEDDTKTIITFIWCSYNANSFTSDLLVHLWVKFCLFTLQSQFCG